MRLHAPSATLLALFVVLAPVRASGQSTSSELAAAGWRAIKASDADKAASLFRDALARAPRDADLNYGAGLAAHLQGRDDEASRHLKKALEIEPRFSSASALLGEIAYHDGDLDLAIKTYEKAIAL